MAIDYERVNWGTTSYVNPQNMNQMDKGIEDACNGVDNLNTSVDERIGDMSTLPHPDDDLSSNITAINSTLENIRYSKYVEITQNIPASGGTFSDTEYDLSSYIPSNAKNVIVNLSRLGEYNLPYCDNQGKMLTGVIYYRASTKKVVLRNFTSAWNNYTAFFEISYEL